MKQFFDYHSKISSLELSQAFATTMAPGPFVGFVSGYINTIWNKLTIYPQNVQKDACALVEQQYLDEVYRRYMSYRYPYSTSSKPSFGCITKDGTIYTSDEIEIEVPIQGNYGSIKEVILFAVHSPISEDISNPVTFVAYYNTSSEAIYPLYKQSVDAYYQQSSDITDPLLDSTLTFSKLDDLVKTACPEYVNNYDTYTIIGIYGNGKDLDTGSNENFAIVPYFSKFPMVLNYNTAIHSALIKSLDTITSLRKRLKGEIGEVHMYAGKDIPEGYLLCNGQECSQVDYPDLYQVLGDQYNTSAKPNGGYYQAPDAGKFRVPDLRARFIVGRYDTEDDYSTLGQSGGEAEVYLETSQLPSHSHSVDNFIYMENHNTLTSKVSGAEDGVYGLVSGKLTKGSYGNVDADAQTGYTGLSKASLDKDNDTISYVTMDSGNTGWGQAHENRPPYYVLMYIIRAKI